MNMIQKMYNCAMPVWADEGLAPGASEYQVSAWQAMGSDTVNLRLRDDKGWYEFHPVQVEKLSSYAAWGVKSMDDLIEYLFYVVKA